MLVSRIRSTGHGTFHEKLELANGASSWGAVFEVISCAGAVGAAEATAGILANSNKAPKLVARMLPDFIVLLLCEKEAYINLAPNELD